MLAALPAEARPDWQCSSSAPLLGDTSLSVFFSTTETLSPWEHREGGTSCWETVLSFGTSASGVTLLYSNSAEQFCGATRPVVCSVSHLACTSTHHLCLTAETCACSSKCSITQLKLNCLQGSVCCLVLLHVVCAGQGLQTLCRLWYAGSVCCLGEIPMKVSFSSHLGAYGQEGILFEVKGWRIYPEGWKAVSVPQNRLSVCEMEL